MPERCRLAVAVLLVCLALPAMADSRITMSKHADAVPEAGQPELNTTTTIWLGKNRFREDAEGQSTIVDLESKRIYVLFHADKIYHVIAMPVDLRTLVPEEALPMLEASLQQMQMEVEITPTDQIQEIGGFSARRYDVGMTSQMGVTMQVETWRTSEIGFDVEMYKKMMLETAALQPAATEWMAKLFEIDGFPVRRVTRVTLMSATMVASEEVTEVQNLDAPPGTYLPPEDYTEQPFDLLQMMLQ